MEFDQDRMTSQELGFSLGVLTGIIVLQSSGSAFGLLVLPVLGIALSFLIARLNNSHPWAEEE